MGVPFVTLPTFADLAALLGGVVVAVPVIVAWDAIAWRLRHRRG